jgi:hypothetical protein
MSEPDLLQNDALARVRISLAEFETLEKEERIRRVLDEVGRGPGLGKKQGVYAFETMLAPLKLAGDTDPEIRKTILEMYHIRNVIVHRGSLADRRLVEGCPWLGLKVGSYVAVTHESLMKYGHALCEYSLTVSERLGNVTTGISENGCAIPEKKGKL